MGLVALPLLAEAIQFSHDPPACPLVSAHHTSSNRVGVAWPGVLRDLRRSRAARAA